MGQTSYCVKVGSILSKMTWIVMWAWLLHRLLTRTGSRLLSAYCLQHCPCQPEECGSLPQMRWHPEYPSASMIRWNTSSYTPNMPPDSVLALLAHTPCLLAAEHFTWQTRFVPPSLFKPDFSPSPYFPSSVPYFCIHGMHFFRFQLVLPWVWPTSWPASRSSADLCSWCTIIPADSLWDAVTGKEFFRAAMCLKSFHVFLRIIRFDNHDLRPVRRQL